MTVAGSDSVNHNIVNIHNIYKQSDSWLIRARITIKIDEYNTNITQLQNHSNLILHTLYIFKCRYLINIHSFDESEKATVKPIKNDHDQYYSINSIQNIIM